MTEQDPEFANDMLRGAEEIAAFLFGDPTMRRKVYHLIATTRLPYFKLGSMICMRKSVLLRWIQDHEGKHANDNRKPGRHSVKIGNV